MKKNLSLLVVAMLTLISQSTHTNNIYNAPCDSVYLDSPRYTVDTQFRTLILKPSASNLHFAAQAKPLPLISPNWSIFDIKPKYHFGFDLGMQVICHCSNSSIGINWEHYKSSFKTSHEVPEATDMIGPFFEIGPDAAPYKMAEGRTKFKFDTMHINVGQFVEFGCCLETNFFAGINVTSLKQTLTTTYANNDLSISRTIVTPISFVGAGPEIGMHFAYDIVKDFYFTGKFATAILAGRAKNHTTYISRTALPEPNIQQTRVNKRTIIVPVLEERLGLAYHFPFKCHYMIKLEAGYEARVYFNALQSIDMGSEVIDIVTRPAEIGVYARTFQRNISNFALFGPYVALNAAF